MFIAQATDAPQMLRDVGSGWPVNGADNARARGLPQFPLTFDPKIRPNFAAFCQASPHAGIYAMRADIEAAHALWRSLSAGNPVKSGASSRHSKHAGQNLWPLNSRWLWFVEYFVKCRGRGFANCAPGADSFKVGGAIRMLPIRACVWLPSRNISGFPWFSLQPHGSD